MNPPEELLTQRETLERLGITRYRLRKLEREEGLPRAEGGGYPWPAVREWLADHEEEQEEGQPAVLSQTEAAERLGLSSRQLRRLGDEGIPREGQGYPWPAVRDWYIDFKQQEAVERMLGGADASAEYYAARARKEAAIADLREMEVEERRAEMLHVDDLDALVHAPLRELARRIEELPDRLAPLIAGRSLEMGEVATALRQAVHDFLEELADDVPFPRAPDEAQETEWITQREATTRLGLSAYMIRKLEREEGLPRGEDGLYPWPEVRNWLEVREEAQET